MPGFGMQGFGMGGDWRMAPFNGFGGGGFAPMQPPGMMRPGTGGGGFAPMPGGMSSDDDSFGVSPGSPLLGLSPNDGPGFQRPGGIPGVGPGLQGPRPGGVSPIGPGLQGPRPGGMPGAGMGGGMQRPGGMMSPGGPPAAMPGSGRNNPIAGDSIGDSPYWQKPSAGGQGLFGPQSNFQMNTRGFDGQNYANQGDYWNKVGAFVDTINQDRARLSGQSGQQMGPPPQRDFAGMWQQAGDKVQGGWQNPFAQGGQQQGGDRVYAGGTPYFDERTGQRTQPPGPSTPSQGGWQQANPGYGTDPSKRGGIRTADFRDKDGDRVDDRDQDGPGMSPYGRGQGGGGQNSGSARPQSGQSSGAPYSAYGQQGGQNSGYVRPQGGQSPGQPASSPYSMDFGNKTMNVQPGGGKVSAYDQNDPMKWVREYRQSKGGEGQQAGQNFASKWNSVNATQGGQSPYSRIASSAPQSMYRR